LNLIDTRSRRGLNAKLPPSSSFGLGAQEHTGGGGGPGASNRRRPGAPGVRPGRGIERGGCRDPHHRRGRGGAAAIRPAAEGKAAGSGSLWTATLRRTSGRGERLRRSSATSRTSWRGLIASEDGGRDEPVTMARWPAAHGSVGAGNGGSGARWLEQGLGHAAHSLHIL
jgi:hypothetical protein